MEYLVIIIDKDYNSHLYWFDNKLEALILFRDSRKLFSNVTLYAVRELDYER